MDQIKELYDQAMALKKQDKHRDSITSTENGIPQLGKCLFDRNCPVPGCPFREGQSKKPNASVDQKASVDAVPKAVEDNELKTQKNDGRRMESKRSSKMEIVDDADLFVVKVGRVDPCHMNVLKYQDRSMLTTFTEEFPPMALLPAK